MAKSGNEGIGLLDSILRGVKKAEEGAIWGSQDVQLKHEGKEIILPADPANMPIDAAISRLEQIKKDEEQVFSVSELVAGAPWDAAVAVYRALTSIYGVVSPQSTKTWFGDIPPSFVAVKCGPGKTDYVSVPVGKMLLPNVDSPVDIIMRLEGMMISGKVKKRDRSRITEIAEKAKELLRTQSVYKAQAIKLDVDDGGGLDLGRQPEFLDLASVSESDIVHNDDVAGLISVNIFSPLKNTEACRKHRIPLKRGILMSGPYGTGKSLTARVSAKIAIDNGWTFIMLTRSRGLASALELAKMYQPCMIFAEDVDRTADREEETVNDLVNILDGVDTKTNEIMVVLTTNHIEKIDKALLRPGRFDAVITLRNPDAKASQSLVRKYAGDLLAADSDLTTVGELLNDISPAAIREVVERSKLAMLAEDRESLSVEDLRVSAYGMRSHMELLAAPVAPKGPKEQLWEGMRGLISEAGGLENDSSLKLDEVMNSLRTVYREAQNAKEAAMGAGHSAESSAEIAGKILETVSKKR